MVRRYMIAFSAYQFQCVKIDDASSWTFYQEVPWDIIQVVTLEQRWLHLEWCPIRLTFCDLLDFLNWHSVCKTFYSIILAYIIGFSLTFVSFISSVQNAITNSPRNEVDCLVLLWIDIVLLILLYDSFQSSLDIGTLFHLPAMSYFHLLADFHSNIL